jgi:predicted nuclease with TOPRIM domain
MSSQAQLWMPAILALFGSLIVVSFTAWINTRAVLAQTDALRAHIDAVRAELAALRAEFKKDLAEFELRLNTRLSALERRIERLEEQRGLGAAVAQTLQP